MNNSNNKDEIKFFSKLENEWWNLNGSLQPLHKLADVRIEFIVRNALKRYGKEEICPLSNLKCLDVGCGGGILSERVKRLGADITGIDLSKELINVAKKHSKNSSLKIKYECISTRNFIKKYPSKLFDIVIASEVIEHVDNRENFIEDLSKLMKVGALLFITTLNSSFTSIFFSKIIGENILSLIPKGTHDVKKFVSPNLLKEELMKKNIFVDDIAGFTPVFSSKDLLNKKIKSFKLSQMTLINYGVSGIKIN